MHIQAKIGSRTLPFQMVGIEVLPISPVMATIARLGKLARTVLKLISLGSKGESRSAARTFFFYPFMVDLTANLPPRLERLMVSDASSCPEIAAASRECWVVELVEEVTEVRAGKREYLLGEAEGRGISPLFYDDQGQQKIFPFLSTSRDITVFFRPHRISSTLCHLRTP